MSVVFAGEKQPKKIGKMLKNKKIELRSDDDIKKNFSHINKV